MNAAIYARVSTEQQEREGASLQTQLDACLAHCQRKGYQVTHRFVGSESGLILDQPMRNELRELVRNRLIDVVVVYCVDRLSRDPTHGSILFDELEQHDVKIEGAAEDIDNSDLGRLISYIRGYAAKVEAEKIKERSLRGKRGKALQGIYPMGGTMLFGYVRGPGKNAPRVIHDAQAETVRKVFNWVAHEKYTLYQVAAELNRLGIKGLKGGRWANSAIYRLVSNPAYKGTTYAFKYRVAKAFSRTHARYTKHFVRDSKEWIEVPGYTPAIVDEKTWELAQEQLKTNRLKSTRNRQHDYLFINGRLRCGVCGHAMIGAVKHKPKGDRRYYRCICNVKTDYYPKCSQKMIPADPIEEAVWAELVIIRKSPEEFHKELDRAQKAPVVSEADIILVQNQIARLRKEEERWCALYGKERIEEDVLVAQLDSIRPRRKEAERKLADLAARKAQADLDTAGLESSLAFVWDTADKFDNPTWQDKLEVLDKFNIRVILSNPPRIEGAIPAVQLHSIPWSHNRMQLYPFRLPLFLKK